MNISNGKLSQTPVQRFYIQQELLNDLNSNFDQRIYSGCNPILVQNCLKSASVSMCQVCIENFNVDQNGICNPYPKPLIPNCNSYLNSNIWIECMTRFYLINSSTCQAVPSNTNCQLFDPKNSILLCLQCQNDYFLNSAQNCQIRTNSPNILSCNTYSIKDDSCAVCDQGFAPTKNGPSRLSIIQNCKTYDVSDINTVQFNCLVCIDGYYLSNNSCL